MKVEDYIGHRIQTLRRAAGLSQEQLGERIERLLGKPWPRQAVSAAELGKRGLPAVELVAIASVLDTTAAQLITPPIGLDQVDMPGGEPVSVVRPRSDDDELTRQIEMAEAAAAAANDVYKQAAQQFAEADYQLRTLVKIRDSRSADGEH